MFQEQSNRTEVRRIALSDFDTSYTWMVIVEEFILISSAYPDAREFGEKEQV